MDNYVSNHESKSQNTLESLKTLKYCNHMLATSNS